MKHFQTIIIILNSILGFTGKQCSSFRHAVTLSYFCFRRVNLVVKLCTRCSFLWQFLGKTIIDYCNNQCGKLLVRALPVCLRLQSDMFLYFLCDGSLPWQFYICFVYAFFKRRFSSRYAPKYLIMFTLDPKSINNVLVSFILSLFSSIQVLTCLGDFRKHALYLIHYFYHCPEN